MKWAKQDSVYEQCLQQIEEVLRDYNLELHMAFLRDPNCDFTLKLGDKSLGSGFSPGVVDVLPRLCEEEQLYLCE